MKGAVLFAATGFSAIASAAIATINPCPSCPSTAAPAPITVTSQYQPVSTCTPLQVCSTTTDTSDISATSASLTCRIEPDCTTYDFVSTVIPFLAGSSSTTVTELDAIVTIDHTSTVLTSLIPITTRAPVFNGTLAIKNTTLTTYTLTSYKTLIIDTWCPYNQLGPLAIPGYGGSGLCKACTADPKKLSQVVTVRDCVGNSTCSTTTKTWVSLLPIATSTGLVTISTQTALPSGGTYVVPIVTVCPPADSHYGPVTKSLDFTTAVYYPTIIHITKIVDITFIGYPIPTATTTLSECPLSTSTYCPTNGIHTVPMYTTIYPTLPGYGSPIIIDIDVTITVINAPTFIFPTTIIIVTLTSTPETVTVISGTTVTAPVTTTVTTTDTNGNLPIQGSETSTGFSASETFSFTETDSASFSASETISFSASESESSASETISFSASETFPVVSSTIETDSASFTESVASSTTSIAIEPTAQSLAGFDFLGCFGTPAGLQTFDLQFVRNDMTPELCAVGCQVEGLPFSGTYQTECYCAATLDPVTPLSAGVCGLSCPGDATLSCGNNSGFRRRLRARLVNPSKLLDVYQFVGLQSSTSATISASETISVTDIISATDIASVTEIISSTTIISGTDDVSTTGTTSATEITSTVDGETSITPSPESSFGPSSTIDPETNGVSTTADPAISSIAPLPLEAFDVVGCLGSSTGFPTFDLQFSDLNMTPELCANSCKRDGLAYSGLYRTDCYCAASLGDQTDETSSGSCGIPCPGNAPGVLTPTCGGDAAPVKLRLRDVPSGRLLDVYVYTPIVPPAPTPTETDGPVTQTMSDGNDPTLEPRALDADMELNDFKQRVPRLRRGGMLRGEKKSNANLRVKRDFGMRNPYGL